VARVVVVLDDVFGHPVTSGAVGVLEGRTPTGSLPPVMCCADRTTLWMQNLAVEGGVVAVPGGDTV
jgi:hypothetical protein